MKEGVFVHETNLYLRYLAPAPLELHRASIFSFVVPNKVKKTSVGRHLIKRRLTAAVEKLLITLKPGLSAVIFAKKDISKLPFAEVEKEVMELLRKAKMF